MKSMTCKQLGGACELEFCADTFEETAELSKKHGMEMFRSGDAEHLKAMEEMNEIMKSSEGMREWYENKKSEFDEMPEIGL